jgi:hypothetical protein
MHLNPYAILITTSALMCGTVIFADSPVFSKRSAAAVAARMAPAARPLRTAAKSTTERRIQTRANI